KTAPHHSCSSSAKLQLSGVHSAGTCSVGWSCEEVEDLIYQYGFEVKPLLYE
ncbi:unnamed protein product, partial [Bubo scandiacus]